MYFTVLPNGTRTSASARSEAFLLIDNWDDWFKFSTLYSLVIFDAEGTPRLIGGVKIGQFAMTKDQRRPDISNRFDQLDERSSSLRQNDTYYDDLNKLGTEIQDKVLHGLRDIAFDINLFERVLPDHQVKSADIQYAYVGLKRRLPSRDAKVPGPKSPEQLSRNFGLSISVCPQGARASR